MAKATPATALEKAGIAFTLHEYDYDPNAARIGMQAAEALGIAPERLLKTLMAKAGTAIVCVLAALRQGGQPEAARGCRRREGRRDAAAGRGRAHHRLSCRRHLAVRAEEARGVFIERAALAHPTILVNGGRRGLQIEIAPADLVRAIDAKAADLC